LVSINFKGKGNGVGHRIFNTYINTQGFLVNIKSVVPLNIRFCVINLTILCSVAVGTGVWTGIPFIYLFTISVITSSEAL